MTTRRILWALCALSLVVQAVIYTAVTSKPVIRSDGVGYQAYLPALLVDHDLSFRTLARREFGGEMPYWTGIHPGPAGYVDKYPVGLSLLQAPFFIAARLIARLAGCDSVYSAPYQVGAAVAGAWYFACGGACVWVLLRRFFAAPVALAALGFTVLGTNLLHYATYDVAFSHVYSFFLIAALLVAGTDLPHAGTKRWLLVGLLAGLVVATRPTNAIVALLIVADALHAARRDSHPLAWLRLGWGRVGAAALVALMPVVLQLLYWKKATGEWLYYSYGREGFDFSRPAGLRLLFGFEKGWFVYVPLAALAVAGWILARRTLAPYARMILPFAVANVWIIASWHDWGYGGAFSIRPLVEASPLVALGVAGLLQWAWPRAGSRRIALAVCSACAVYTMILMLGYWMHTLPYLLATGHDILESLKFSWLRR